MLNSRYPLLLARIAQSCRLLVLALMVAGMFSTSVHSEAAIAPEIGVPVSNLLSGQDSGADLPATALAAPAATCPAQTSSCHHGQSLAGLMAQYPDALMTGSHRRLIPAAHFAAGQRANPDHPPPIA